MSSQPAYDLDVAGLGLVQVKTLRSTPGNDRTSMGQMTDPYDILCPSASALTTAQGGMGDPAATVELIYPHGSRSSLTAKLLASSSIVPILEQRLVEAAGPVAAGEAPGRHRSA